MTVDECQSLPPGVPVYFENEQTGRIVAHDDEVHTVTVELADGAVTVKCAALRWDDLGRLVHRPTAVADPAS